MTAQWIRIQNIVPSINESSSDLYLKSSGQCKFYREELSFHLSQNSSLVFATVYNCFHYAYFCKNIQKVAPLRLSFKFAGKTQLRIFSQQMTGSDTEILTAAYHSTEKKLVEISFDIPPDTLTLYCSFHTLEEEAEISDAGWEILSEKVEDVVLDVITTSMGKWDDHLEKNVKNILAYTPLTKEISKIILIRHVNIPIESRFQDLSRIQAVYQKNLGSTGGNVRGILESAKNSASTHVLLCDDDTVIDPESVFRVSRIFSISSNKPFVGSLMLKMSDPYVVHEKGANFVIGKRGVEWDFLFHEKNILDKDSSKLMFESQEADYAAWFFLAFPKSAVKEIGFPIPYFLHFDDIEFTLRAGQFGYKLLCPPTVVLWHNCDQKGYAETDLISYLDNRNAYMTAYLRLGALAAFRLSLYYFRYVMRQVKFRSFRRAEIFLLFLRELLFGLSSLKRGPQLLFEKLAELKHPRIELPLDHSFTEMSNFENKCPRWKMLLEKELAFRDHFAGKTWKAKRNLPLQLKIVCLAFFYISFLFVMYLVQKLQIKRQFRELSSQTFWESYIKQHG